MEAQFNIEAARNGLRVQTERQLRMSIAVLMTAFAMCVASAGAAESRSVSFDVPSQDVANAQALADHLAALSANVKREEAKLLANCAYAKVSLLRRQYRMFATPMFNNVLIYTRIKKRGYCYHWAEDLLLALDALKLTTLELHWGETHSHTWRENNCLVVTANGQPFNQGIILECWEHFGRLHWGRVVDERDHYHENAAFQRLFLAKNGRIALQTQTKVKQKTN